MKIHFSIILCSLLVLLSCKREIPEQKEDLPLSIVTGKIVNYTKYSATKMVSLQKTKSGISNPSLEGKINEDGSFKIEFEQRIAENYILKPFENIYLFINPGDNVHLEIDLDKEGGVSFLGDSKEYNQLLSAFYSEGYYGEKTHENLNILSTLTPDEYLDYRDNIRNQKLKSLENFSKTKSIPLALKKSLHAQILNNEYVKLLEYGISNCSAINNLSAKEIEMKESFNYFAAVKQEINDNADNLTKHSSFNEFLNTYQIYFFHSLLNLDLKSLRKRPDKYFQIINAIIEKEENPILKENLLFEVSKFMLEANEVEEFILFENRLKEHIQSKHFLKELEEKFERLKKDGINTKPLQNYVIEEGSFLDSLVSKYKGKVIYLDFWATWCSPCISDLRESREILNTDYAEKEVVFIYLCTGINENECTAILEEYEISGIHITLDGRTSQKIMSQFYNSALPFQIIINKAGEVMRKGTQYRLSSPITKTLITKLTKE